MRAADAASAARAGVLTEARAFALGASAPAIDGPLLGAFLFVCDGSSCRCRRFITVVLFFLWSADGR